VPVTHRPHCLVWPVTLVGWPASRGSMADADKTPHQGNSTPCAVDLSIVWAVVGGGLEGLCYSILLVALWCLRALIPAGFMPRAGR